MNDKIGKMDAAAEEDVQEHEAKRPAVNKLRMLAEVQVGASCMGWHGWGFVCDTGSVMGWPTCRCKPGPCMGWTSHTQAQLAQALMPPYLLAGPSHCHNLPFPAIPPIESPR